MYPGRETNAATNSRTISARTNNLTRSRRGWFIGSFASWPARAPLLYHLIHLSPNLLSKPCARFAFFQQQHPSSPVAHTEEIAVKHLSGETVEAYIPVDLALVTP